MQAAAPRLQDISDESPATHQLYGLDDPATQQLRPPVPDGPAVRRTRRAVRAGHATATSGTSTATCKKDHARNAAEVDKPIAGLLADLKARGLLDDTLVLWGGEFGRTPTAQGNDGRDHNPHGYTMWLAGGGVKPGIQLRRAPTTTAITRSTNKVHLHDLHATILHLLGLDHTRLTYRYAGRDFRLTDVHGEVVHDLIA